MEAKVPYTNFFLIIHINYDLKAQKQCTDAVSTENGPASIRSDFHYQVSFELVLGFLSLILLDYSMLADF